MTTPTPKPKLGPAIDPNSAPPTAVVVVPVIEQVTSEWGSRCVSTGLALDLNAAILVDLMTKAHLTHTRQSIIDGVRPDGGGDQRALGPRAAAAPGRQSDHRNYKTGELADGLRRTEIQSDGQTASSTVLPSKSRQAHVARERARGVVLITGAGAAGEAAIAGARAGVEAMLSGRQVKVDDGEVDAKEAGK